MIKVLEVFRLDGSRLWLYRRSGAVLQLSPGVLGMPYTVHVVASLTTDKPVAQLLSKIPNNRREPLHPRRKVARNRAANAGFRP